MPTANRKKEPLECDLCLPYRLGQTENGRKANKQQALEQIRFYQSTQVAHPKSPMNLKLESNYVIVPNTGLCLQMLGPYSSYAALV
ncbi:hypothetical protein DAPPUDRAFT_233979 [Daphnia pulex]|uniref:Uncharacterized protein n=1 Tax=Daphnia pulex TaxID=6669 RepID=E9FW98_DAPPU|nr:hypothetical protein DAPPUDRAFT_233979 [Daphnia pulex]|eukprot:EFX88962.1 hypothetical protein DAPPUDRAFT_233979 [Daphnia pulex]